MAKEFLLSNLSYEQALNDLDLALQKLSREKRIKIQQYAAEYIEELQDTKTDKEKVIQDFFAKCHPIIPTSDEKTNKCVVVFAITVLVKNLVALFALLIGKNLNTNVIVQKEIAKFSEAVVAVSCLAISKTWREILE